MNSADRNRFAMTSWLLVGWCGLHAFVFAASRLPAFQWLLGLPALGVAAAVADAVLRNRWSRVAVWTVLAAHATAFAWVLTADITPESRLGIAALILSYATATCVLIARKLRPQAASRLTLLLVAVSVTALLAETVIGRLLRDPSYRIAAIGPRLFGGEWPSAKWEGATILDPTVGWYVYPPHGKARLYYPDNPRGYFDVADIGPEWHLRTHGANQARLDRTRDGAFKILPDNVPTSTPWHVSLARKGYPVVPGERYRLAFRARAGAPRTMEALLAQDRPPWAGMGFYRKIPIAPDWAEVAEEFVISGSDRTAGISFNIGGEEPAVELADVVLTRLSTKEAVVPPVERRYMVQYAFNDHSCRGRDYVIPKPRNAVRILVLGASHTLGSGVHERDVFSTRLEEILNDTPPAGDARRYEVINCGMNAFSPREERQMYRRTADYTPDIVLLMVTENDDRSPQDEKIRRSPDELASKLETIFYSWYVFNSMREFGMARDYTANARELVALHAEVTRDGAVFVPLLFRYAASGAGGVYSAFSAALAATGTRLFDLGDAIVRGHQWSELIVHPIDPHPNEIAHRAAAAETARLLRLQRLLPDAPIPRAIQKP